MDAAVNRVRSFAEGIFVMACPVLLAVVLNKVDVKSKANGFVRNIAPIAASSLWLSFLPFLLLNVSAAISGLFERLSDVLFRVSKVLVHFCTILQMVLAYLILLLITMEAKLLCLFLVPLVLFILRRCYMCSRHDKNHDEQFYKGSENMLEQSLDFSAAVTGMLFLALEGLALEGQASVGLMSNRHRSATAALCLSFSTCVMAAGIMLLGAIPPMVEDEDEDENENEDEEDADGRGERGRSHRRRNKISRILNASCLVLAAFVTVVVFTIVVMALPVPEEAAVAVVVAPWLVTLLVFAIFLAKLGSGKTTQGGGTQGRSKPDPAPKEQHGGEVAAAGDGNAGPGGTTEGNAGEQHKPASLELTKVTFTGFLTVSISTLARGSSYPVRGYTSDAFIVLTAAAVIWGILWRLLTHIPDQCRTKLPAVASAKVASFFAHLFVAAAVIPFVLMAQNTLRHGFPGAG